MNWRRYKPFRTWHTGAENAYSFCTDCNGRWALSEEREGHVEHSDNPPHEDRCEGCQRTHIDRIPVERGLAELVANTDDQNPLGFDLGGESE